MASMKRVSKAGALLLLHVLGTLRDVISPTSRLFLEVCFQGAAGSN